MEYVKIILKKEGWSSLVTSIIFAILGILLINNPEGTAVVISYILGLTFGIIGLYKIITYIKEKGKYDFYNYDMVFGIGTIILGILTIVYRTQIETLLRILIGIWIIYSAMIRISLSLKLKSLDTGKVWVYSILVAALMLICGVYAMFTSNAIIITVGLIILIYSILDIVESIIFLVNLKKLTK